MHGGWQPPTGGPGFGPPPGLPPPPAPQVPGAYGNYEFNPIENAILAKTASRAKLWGVVSIVVGSLQLLSSCGAVKNSALATNLPLGIVGVIVGITFIGVGNSLKSVVETRGNDLMHMMLAMQKMSTAFVIQIICGIVGVLLALTTWFLLAFLFIAGF